MIDNLKKIQKILKNRGCYTGNIDAFMGAGTLKAIQNMDKATAVDLQRFLAELSVYKGEIDGIFGPASNRAFNSLLPAPVLNIARLKAIYPNADTKFVAFINQYAAQYGITTKAQLCGFLAQTIHESNGFRVLRENLNYSAKGLLKTFKKYFNQADAIKYAALGPEAIANRVYGGRMGNGVHNGDGWRYRGGGAIQTTGRNNFSATGKAINVDLINFPNKITEPETAVKAAMYYWQSNGCGRHADGLQLTALRESINNGTIGLAEANTLFVRAWAVLL